MRATRLALTLIALVPLSRAVADNPVATTKPAGGELRTPAVPPERKVVVIKLRYADAKSVCNTLARVFHDDEKAGRLVLAWDSATGSVVISAAPDVLKKVRSLIQSLDTPTIGERGIRLIKLTSSNSAIMGPLLQGLIEGLHPASRAWQRPGLTKFSGDTLIATGTANQIAEVKNLVEILDKAPPPVAQDAPRQTRVQIVIYKVALPRDRITALDVDDLTAEAKTPATLQKALAELGDAAVLYRIDQVVKLSANPSFTIGSSTPFVRGTQTSKGGAKTARISYQDVGCSIDLGGVWRRNEPDSGEARMDLELSSMDDSTVDLGNDRKAKVFRNVKQRFEGAVRTGRPVVLLSLDAGTPQDTATAYVTRFELTRLFP